MTSIEVTRTANTAAPSFGGIFARVVGTVSAWNDARATRKVLSQLSDRALQDIGLTRRDVARITARG